MVASEHYGELHLRRYFAGEIEDAGLHEHLGACEICRARIEGLVAEERAFQEAVSFERFAEGVERKLDAAAAPSSFLQAWGAPLAAVAAAAVVIVAVGLQGVAGVSPRQGASHLKGGGADVDFYVGGQGASRVASMKEPLQPGERLRIAYRPGAWRYLAVVSIDEDGEVSPLYPEAGESLPVEGEPGQTRMLPESVAFTGQGLERVVVIFTGAPLAVDEVVRAARAAFERSGGDLSRMGDLDLPGEHFHRLVIKP